MIKQLYYQKYTYDMKYWEFLLPREEGDSADKEYIRRGKMSYSVGLHTRFVWSLHLQFKI